MLTKVRFFNQAAIPQKVEIRNFQNFFNLLILIFTKNEISDELFDRLSQFEKELLTLLIRRKFRPTKQNPNDYLQPIITKQEIREILKVSLPKKTEECYKFIFSRSFNFIKVSTERSLGTRMSTEEFYSHYFKDTSERLKIPIKDFHYPLTKDLKGKINFNYEYFQKVFKSEKFIGDLNHFLENGIVSQHNEETSRKLTLLLLKWEQMYLQWKMVKDIPYSSLLKQIYDHKRYKIPWTMIELSESVLKFKKLVRVCQDKKDK